MPDGVVYQSINRLLENSFLIAQDDVRSIYFLKLLETVIAINDPTIKIIDIRGGVASAVQGHHRADGRRDDRHPHQKHPLRPSAGINHPLDGADALIQAGYFRRGSMRELQFKFF